MQKYHVIVIGGGPAGSSCALCLAEKGLKVLLIDKSTFPRDKICGDALSIDVVNQLPFISAEAAEIFEKSTDKIPSWGVSIFSPDHTRLDIPFVYKGIPRSGFLCTREHFDNILLQQAKRTWQVDVVEEGMVQKVDYGHGNVMVYTATNQYIADMVIGADGANSVVRRCLKPGAIDRANHSAGLRVYYQGVSSFHNKSFIELHFFKEILPGYLWIFPMSNERVNVGIGILSSEVSKKKINLKEMLQKLIETHPHLKERFAGATPLETPKGFGLPLGSEKRAISGERFLLLGDAAGLIDPFSGEGIGNAMRSGRVAAAHLLDCFRYQNFSADFNKKYDQEIYKRMGTEFRISSSLQKLCRYPFLFNYVITKANNSHYWQRFFLEALSDINIKRRFLHPGFYYKLLFK
jgi:geranylgeranyl reductase family protein